MTINHRGNDPQRVETMAPSGDEMQEGRELARLDLDACRTAPALSAFFAGAIDSAERLGATVEVITLRDATGPVYGLLARAALTALGGSNE